MLFSDFDHHNLQFSKIAWDSHSVVLHQFVAFVRVDVVIVAVMCIVVLLGPVGIHVLLPLLVLGLVLRRLVCFDSGIQFHLKGSPIAANLAVRVSTSKNPGYVGMSMER